MKFLAALALMYSHCAIPEEVPERLMATGIGAPCTTWTDRMEAEPWQCEVYFERQLRIKFKE